jgi:hypothetical protein
MSIGIQRAMWWCGGAFLALLFAGLLTAGFFPPIPADNTATEVAQQYSEDADRIRLGCLFMIFGAAFTIPFYGVVAGQMQRMEGKFTPLVFTEVAAGAAGVVIIIFPVICFAVASYRPERDPELVQLLNDLGWIPLLGVFAPALAQVGAISVAVLADKHPEPIFPRWTAYAMLWSGLLFCPAIALLFFKDGIWAWNGLMAFWIAVPAFGVYTCVLMWATWNAITRQAVEEAAAASAASVQETPLIPAS